MNKYVVGFLFGFIISMILKPSTRFWYNNNPHNLERGDKVRLIHPHPFYDQFDMIYLAGQATSEKNEVWVLLKSRESIPNKIVTDVLDLNDIERIIK